ncbi:MAG TPA: phosphoglycerate mutase family protein [Sphingomicrobium sp.]|jgi:broad specificity phosphatase PhoE|nr:phosphoglycerate mutase family protein [Sphingomicrobium sp.]
MQRFFAFLVALFLATSTSVAAYAADTIFVMRHLQKADGSDPPLSSEGRANAKALSDLLAKSGIKAIFATPTRRAMETAEPLASRLKIKIRTYDPDNPQALIATVDSIRGAVLVVGHSNTVGDLVARFGGKQPVSLTEEDYGTVFVVSHDDGSVSQIKVQRAP